MVWPLGAVLVSLRQLIWALVNSFWIGEGMANRSAILLVSAMARRSLALTMWQWLFYCRMVSAFRAADRVVPVVLIWLMRLPRVNSRARVSLRRVCRLMS